MANSCSEMYSSSWFCSAKDTIVLGALLPTWNALTVGEGLSIGSTGNENIGEGATLSMGVPTTRSLPPASTSIIDGRPGAFNPKSTDLPNMAMVSRVMGIGGVTIGSRDLASGMTVSFHLARCSSGSKCSAPAAPEFALAFSRETVRRCILGIWATSKAVGSRTEMRRSLREEARLGDGDLLVHLLAVGEGVVSNGWYVLGCNKSPAGVVSFSWGVLALYAIGCRYPKGKAGIGLSARSEADHVGESANHWLTVRL
jgi:hypothetical protein